MARLVLGATVLSGRAGLDVEVVCHALSDMDLRDGLPAQPRAGLGPPLVNADAGWHVVSPPPLTMLKVVMVCHDDVKLNGQPVVTAIIDIDITRLLRVHSGTPDRAILANAKTHLSHFLSTASVMAFRSGGGVLATRPLNSPNRSRQSSGNVK